MALKTLQLEFEIIGYSATTSNNFVNLLSKYEQYRYRINDKNLPGKPDLVLPKYRTVIFMHGCHWHGHNKVFGALLLEEFVLGYVVGRDRREASFLLVPFRIRPGYQHQLL